MPIWLRRYLASASVKTHFYRSLAVGALVRGLSAWFVYGPQALDDYKHGVWPAYQFFAKIPLDLPDYRSHLLVWFLSLFVEAASWFGASSALAQVRAMYLGLAFTSLLGIYGTYLYGRTFRSRMFSGLSLYLVALFPIMPFVSTRAFGEAVAMSLVMLGLGWLESVRRDRRTGSAGDWFAGFLFLGVATLFRFHVGLIYVAYGVILIARKKWRGVICAAFAGFVTLALQALIDYGSGKVPLGTLLIYLNENEGGGAKYGVSPWYNPLLMVLALTAAPFSIVLFRSAKNLWRAHWPAVLPCAIFLTAHCVVAHKEERFLYPIIGVEMWALAYLWAANAFNPWARRIFSTPFLVLTALGLLVVCFVNTQEGEIEPPAYVESHFGPVIYLDHESLFGKSRFQFYFLRPPAKLQNIDRMDLNAHSVDEALASDPAFNAAVLLTSEPEARAQISALEGMVTLEASCGQMRAAGSLVDRALYGMNPKHNQRRRPTWYLICERIKKS